MRLPIMQATPKAALTVTTLALAWTGMAAGTAHAAALGCNDVAGLIRQINAINASGTPGQITLASNCTYTITAPDHADPRGSDGLPHITGNVTITGDNTTIQRSDTAARFRIFHVDFGASLTLNKITLTHATAVDHTGGVIDNYGDLTLNDTNMIGNDGDLGGGVYIARRALAHITGGSFVMNEAPDAGGAIANEGTLIVNGTDFRGNATINGGGAIANISGEATLHGVTLFHNLAGRGGGGISNVGAATLTIDGNSSLLENVTLTGPGAITNTASGPVDIGPSVVIRDNMPTNCTGSPTPITCPGPGT